MRFDPDRHHRRSIRLRSYDYAQPGAYFVTVCTHNRQCLFGNVINGEIRQNEYGRIVAACWSELPGHYPRVALDVFVVMPNHVHGVILLRDDEAVDRVGAGFKPAPTALAKRHGLPEVLRGFKTFASRRINEVRNIAGAPVWQRNYYERVIRNESEVNAVRHYIQHNSSPWAGDVDNPANFPGPKPSHRP